MTRPIRLAILDCDGTLLDSQAAIVATMQDAFERHGVAPPEPARVRAIIGLDLVEAVARLLPEARAGAHDEIAATYKQVYWQRRQNGMEVEPLYPGARAAIESLDGGGWLIGMATGKSTKGVARALKSHGLDHFFATIQTSDTAPGKPHPGMIHRALEETGARAEDAAMVGDTAFDMQMARNAGVAAVGVAWGYHPASALSAAGAQTVISSFEELSGVLDGLNGGGR